ncbi:FIST N domain protein [Mycobacterium xenopi 4042]|uniref:FIST N domain protein n=1 Tax=Mycobacterium xenopi 4042 TaxID=1299334 RepID=X8C8U9_MYCXE|nr:FIST N domain protein [Mycobacterium xenopi 4042]
MRIAVGVSTAPDARQAAAEAAAQARDELAGETPSLAVLLASQSHTDHAAEVLGAAQEIVEPPALVGCVAQAVVAGRHEFEDESAVTVWLASGLPPRRSTWTSSAPVRVGCSAATASTGPATICTCCCPTRTRSRRTCSLSTSTPTGRMQHWWAVWSAAGADRAMPDYSATVTSIAPVWSACGCPAGGPFRSCRRVAGRSATHTS